MAKKVKEPVFSERGEPTWRLLTETVQPLLKELIENYQKDKYKARVLFFNKGGNTSNYTQNREVLFEYPNGDFKICKFTKKYGISKTGIMYNRETMTNQFLYVKKKFYIKNGSKFTVPTHSYLKHNPNHFSSEAFVFLKEKFGWIRNILESTNGYSISLNTIVTEKLYNEKKILKKIFKAPWPVIEFITKPNPQEYSFYDKVKIWKEMRQYLINLDSLKSEMYNSHYFNDTCKMAKTLNKRVNCSWSLRRLKQEHDEWAKEISYIVLESQPLTDLKIKQIYLDFANYSGYEILKTNHDIVREGIKQHHCVATYISSVERGHCAIYRVGDYTLELVHGTNWRIPLDCRPKYKTLYTSQLRGVCNHDATKELKDEVDGWIRKFMAEKDMEAYDIEIEEAVTDIFEVDPLLPF
jgi:hypothetical protein